MGLSGRPALLRACVCYCVHVVGNKSGRLTKASAQGKDPAFADCGSGHRFHPAVYMDVTAVVVSSQFALPKRSLGRQPHSTFPAHCKQINEDSRPTAQPLVGRRQRSIARGRLSLGTAAVAWGQTRGKHKSRGNSNEHVCGMIASKSHRFSVSIRTEDTPLGADDSLVSDTFVTPASNRMFCDEGSQTGVARIRKA